MLMTFLFLQMQNYKNVKTKNGLRPCLYFAGMNFEGFTKLIILEDKVIDMQIYTH